MEFLTRFGIEKSRFTILMIIVLLVQGLLIYAELPKRENPAITIRSALVTAQFPGMSPERVENLIAIPIERAAREIGEVEDISTLISTGSTVVTLSVFNSVPQAELDRVFQDIRNRMDDLAKDLPQGTHGPFVNSNYGDVAIATIATTGDGFTYAELEDAAEDLQQSLYTLSGITKVSLYGVQEERIWLEIDSRKLAAVGVQIPEVLNDLRNQNVILGAGEIDVDGTNIILEANGDLGSIEEIENVLTKASGTTGLIRLKDLVNVRRGYVEPARKPVYFNGEPSVLLAVEMAEDRDIQQIGQALRQRVTDFENTQPIGIQYRFSTFQESNVTIAINNALSNVGQTFLVVFIVILVFLGFKPAVIIASIVPFSMMFALMGMRYIGIDLEQISIAAVIISLGLLVDNGLVVVEDIEKRIKAGLTPPAASIAAGGQYFVPLAVASVTTVSAFIPMLILEGTEGEYAFSLGAVVGIMLLGSWLNAHYILPFLCARFLHPGVKDDTDEGWLVKMYGRFIERYLGWGLLIMLVCYGLVVAAVGVFSQLKSEMFPLSERAEFLIYMDLEKGTSIERTRNRALAVDAWLNDKQANPEVSNTTIFVGSGGPRFYLALSPADTDPSSAFFLVNTQSFEGALAASERARRHLAEFFPEARFRVTRLSMGGSESGIVEISLSGPDADILLSNAYRIEAILAKLPGLQFNKNDWGNKRIKVVIDIAQDKAREFGISSKDISDVLDTYLSGTSYSTYREGSDSIPIVIRADENFRDSLEDLANLSVPVGGALISLDQVAVFRPQLEFSNLRRENQVRQVMVSAKSGTMAASEVVDAIEGDLAALNLPDGYTMSVGGETEDSAEVNAKLAAGLPIALAVMIAALTFQFNSARRVLLTFMTIPLIIVGAPLALFVTDQPLSFFAILGLISLMGIIINNAIVLIDQVDIEWQSADLRQAIIVASKKRITPIILTSTTTVLGLLPMAMTGGALFEPMATLMIGGLLLASPLSLFFVPSIYYLFFRWRI